MKKFITILLCILWIACSSDNTKTWKVNDFSQDHTFVLKKQKYKSPVSANIWLDGEITDTIYLSVIKGDSSMVFTQKDLPTGRIFADFYEEEFTLYLNKSNATGNLKIKIKI